MPQELRKEATADAACPTIVITVTARHACRKAAESASGVGNQLIIPAFGPFVHGSVGYSVSQSIRHRSFGRVGGSIGLSVGRQLLSQAVQQTDQLITNRTMDRLTDEWTDGVTDRPSNGRTSRLIIQIITDAIGRLRSYAAGIFPCNCHDN